MSVCGGLSLVSFGPLVVVTLAPVMMVRHGAVSAEITKHYHIDQIHCRVKHKNEHIDDDKDHNARNAPPLG